MDGRRLGLLAAFAVGVAGFALAIGLDELPGSSSWPGGPEIVLPIAMAVTLAAALALAWTLDRRSMRATGIVVLVASAGFALAWGAFVGLQATGTDCGYTPTVEAEGRFEGNWSNARAQEGLVAHGLRIVEREGDRVEGRTELDDGTVFEASLSVRAAGGVRFGLDFRSGEDFDSSSAAQSWSANHREVFEQRYERFTTDIEQATGWTQAGNVSWYDATMVC